MNTFTELYNQGNYLPAYNQLEKSIDSPQLENALLYILDSQEDFTVLSFDDDAEQSLKIAKYFTKAASLWLRKESQKKEENPYREELMNRKRKLIDIYMSALNINIDEELMKNPSMLHLYGWAITEVNSYLQLNYELMNVDMSANPMTDEAISIALEEGPVFMSEHINQDHIDSDILRKTIHEFGDEFLIYYDKLERLFTAGKQLIERHPQRLVDTFAFVKYTLHAFSSDYATSFIISSEEAYESMVTKSVEILKILFHAEKKYKDTVGKTLFLSKEEEESIASSVEAIRLDCLQFFANTFKDLTSFIDLSANLSVTMGINRGTGLDPQLDQMLEAERNTEFHLRFLRDRDERSVAVMKVYTMQLIYLTMLGLISINDASKVVKRHSYYSEWLVLINRFFNTTPVIETWYKQSNGRQIFTDFLIKELKPTNPGLANLSLDFLKEQQRAESTSVKGLFEKLTYVRSNGILPDRLNQFSTEIALYIRYLLKKNRR